MVRKTHKKRRTKRRPSESVNSKYTSNAPTAVAGRQRRILSSRPDSLDFRDKMYVPTLVEVPIEIKLTDYIKIKIPILNQGQEGACTGFGLTTVAHYLLWTLKVYPNRAQVSPHMFYDMARRYDEWAGVNYEGSSCRGAMKGWFKHGVCARDLWKTSTSTIRTFTHDIAEDAASRPLGAYYRVNHKDLVAMHAAITEAGILYASGTVHSGWENVKKDGLIKYGGTPRGGHAFAIVAYDEDGFWIQNSWGKDWGRQGFCHITYQDWLDNGSDVWVARLGAPVHLTATPRATGTRVAGAVRSQGFHYNDIRPHVISIRNDGQLDESGDIGTSPDMVREILQQDFPRITNGWQRRRLVLYAHGGLVSQQAALQRVSDYRETMLKNECYPLAFIWKSDYWTTLKDMLQDAITRRRPEGILDSAKDFMLDRLDDALEPIARVLTGKASWDEMKENALLATTTATGGARIVCDEIAKLRQHYPGLEIHLAGHSAGSIFHAPLIQYLTAKGAISTGPMTASNVTGLGLTIKTCTLWAPACTTQLFKDCYLDAINNKSIGRFAVFSLTDKAERDDDCARIYNKSLLYLVSDAFEKTTRIPLIHPDGEPILGMEKFIRLDNMISSLFKAGKADWILSPNNEPDGSPNAAKSAHHGDFDDDKATVLATLSRILGRSTTKLELTFQRGESSKRSIRRRIDGVADATLTR